jgi:glycerol-3-phosphate dehydrogenase
MITPAREAPSAVDVIVIGAGINGLAVARELSYGGQTVAVFDRSDIASETSAISTRLIHGGLKYLERGEINLVLECARERKILFATAPHLIREYPMLIPFLRQNKRPPWMLVAGLVIEEFLTLKKPVPRSELVGPRRMATDWPSLSEAGVRYGAVYHDSQVPLTERFCVELAMDSVEHGAIFLSYTEVTEVVSGPEGVTGVAWRDVHTGEQGEMSAPIIVNVAGPWIDSILHRAVEGHPQLIGPTRGSHFMVDRFEGAPDTCIFFESPVDSRPMFILPWEGMYMLGSTDIPVALPTSPIVADGGEVEYILNSVNGLLPQARLEARDILWSYSGVRPLPYAEGVDDPAAITRDYRLDTHSGSLNGMFTVVGGKWTTHRALGEDVARKVRAHAGLPVMKSLTRQALLPGAREGESAEPAVRPDWLSTESETRLRRLYGNRAQSIIARAAAQPALRQILDEESGAIAAEIWWAIHEEGAKTLGDIVLRRMAAFIGRRAGVNSAETIAQLLVDWGEWSQARAEQELADYIEWIRRYTPLELERTW